MGNFSSKDNHGPVGSHLENFHTPPSSPLSDGTGSSPSPAQLQGSPTVQASSSPASPVATTSGKKAQLSPPVSPRIPIPPPDWSPPPPASPGVTPLHKRSGCTFGGRGRSSLGRNGAPPSSTPRTLPSPIKSVDISPIKSPSSVSAAAPVTCSVGQSLKERDGGEGQPVAQTPEDTQSQDRELVELLKECASTLGVTSSQDGTPKAKEILKHLLTEVNSLKTTLKTEREEWLQFQADLQVAVAVADRLRAEMEEELVALRKAHKDTERELAAALQRQKEADMQLVSLQGELKESRQRLTILTRAPEKGEARDPHQTPDRSGAESKSEHKDGSERGRGMGSKSPSDAGEGARTDCKGGTKGYLRNVTNEDRDGKDVQPSEPRRAVTSERSRSLSRLPASPDSPTTQNGPTQPKAALTLEATKNFGQQRARRSLDWQDSQLNSDAGKREESLNKHNSALTELPHTKSQDGLSVLLRRHGGSKRNSLLRWCQNRTQGYKNIDITNFSSSWADGLAFCAVYHTYVPSHIPFSTLSPENKKENLSLAFKTGEGVGITQTLTIEEMLRAGGPDWQRVLSYVESMYRHFEM
ncbi:cytospin-A isoform X2 [Oryzias latipes]|uniref:cytospin-A isoform X2 n=1 Tax=Oryzias latipes TaxID=8090 RepID=UPI0002A4B9F2|nr:cytospin-A isoform X2 [Oryzias latipes]